MTEIRLDVELPHPPGRVWRALTEPRLVNQWFLPTVPDPSDRNRFEVQPARADGFTGPLSAQVVESVRPIRLVMRLQADDLHVRVTVTLEPRPDGCRLTFVQRGYLGPHGTLRRRVLRATYARLLTERLPEALDGMGADEPVPAASGNSSAALRREGGRWGNGRARWVRPSAGSAAASPAQACVVRPRDGNAASSGTVYGRPADEGADAGSATDAVGGTAGMVTTRVRGRASVPGTPLAHTDTWVEPRTRRDARQRAGEAFAPVGRRVRTRRPAHGAAAVARPEGHRPTGRWQPVARECLAWLRAIPGWSAERRSRAVALGALLLLLIALVMVLVARLTVRVDSAPPQVGGGDQREPGFAVVPGESGRPLGTASVGGSASPRADGPLAGPATRTGGSVLTGAYQTTATWVGGYRGEVTVSNPSSRTVEGWTATVTLPLLGLAVDSAHGAQARQTGKTVTFTPVDATRSIPPGAAVRFDFAVNGVGSPSGCTVDDHACAGIPG